MKKIAIMVAAGLLACAHAWAGEAHFTDMAGKFVLTSQAISSKEFQSKLDDKTKKIVAQYINVSGPVTKIDDRFYVLKGCMPHACGFSEGYFVADSQTGDVRGWWTDNGKTFKTYTSKNAAKETESVEKAVKEWKGKLFH